MHKVNYEIWRDDYSLTMVQDENRVSQPHLVDGCKFIGGIEINFEDEDDLINKLEEYRDEYVKNNWDEEANTWKS